MIPTFYGDIIKPHPPESGRGREQVIDRVFFYQPSLEQCKADAPADKSIRYTENRHGLSKEFLAEEGSSLIAGCARNFA